jgi:TRAP transporter TAXI family solute receptor
MSPAEMKKRSSTTFAELATVWSLVTVVIAFGFVITYQYVAAPPPKVVRMATGATDGAYYRFGQQYARLLADDGITLQVVPTAGSVENFVLLKKGDVSLALVQGGSASDEDRQQLQSLGSLFLEPLWVFTRSGNPIHRLADLVRKRIAVGAVGSGTSVLSTQLLTANGITESNADLSHGDSSEAIRLLLDGHIDVAIFVASPEAPLIRSVIETPGIELIDLHQTAAYARRFPFLTALTISEGVLDLKRNIPAHDTRVMAASASLAAREDLNTGLIPALLNVITRVHEPGGVLEQRRQFPSVDFIDLPLNEDAAHYIRNGPSFLFRWLPYRTAVLMDRLKLLLLPFVALLIPLLRVGPLLYQWRVRSRIYRWYAAVRDIDTALLGGTPESLEPIGERLRVLEREVASVSVPLSYAVEQYHLRVHIRLLQDRLDAVARQALARADHQRTDVRDESR